MDSRDSDQDMEEEVQSNNDGGGEGEERTAADIDKVRLIDGACFMYIGPSSCSVNH